MTNYKLSIFNNAFQTTGTETNLTKEINDIRNGTYKPEIINCRTALIEQKNKELYTKYKSQLKAVTFCGMFKDGRKLSNLVHYNGLIVIDIDNLQSDKIIEIKKYLITDEYIMALWDSPSSLGFKGLVKIDSNVDNHKLYFSSLSIYFLQKYDIELDKSGSDITRLCYVSWDENIFTNYDSKVFSDIIEVENKSLKTSDKNPNTQTEKQPSEKLNISLSKSAYATEGMNKPNDKKQIKKIITYLNNKDISITDTFDNWIKVAVIIANSFSYDVGENYFLSLCKIDKNKHDEQKSINLLKYCYNNRKINNYTRLNFATLMFIATEKGFQKK
ncbi:BT4734/BF3469 family protein [Flavobacterium difficile]|uniref:BT4734-like N-terminal domain-containing protein n=1 Tax=Flavobacterium difficile TaxID=2709659 RepID=A0ABX0I6E5_9FLAO|nr:BT4734/BF3469 family protein [Flavobacterium difficile]NHM01685.1 hypothetical protein [Flavobacterium difficile]